MRVTWIMLLALELGRSYEPDMEIGGPEKERKPFLLQGYIKGHRYAMTSFEPGETYVDILILSIVI